jgi:hypothetical protein
VKWGLVGERREERGERKEKRGERLTVGLPCM